MLIEWIKQGKRQETEQETANMGLPGNRRIGNAE